MTKEVLSDRQGIFLMCLFVLGSTVLVGSGGAAKKDMWLAMIIACALSLPLVFIYAKLLSKFHGKNIFEISEIVFGKIFGKIITLLYTWYALHLGALVLDNYGEFIQIVGLPETPRIVPIFLFVLLNIWVAKEGVEVLGRWGELFLIFILGTMFITVIFAIPKMHLNNIRPVLEDGITPLLKGTFGIFSFPFAETVLFTMITPCWKTKKSPYKVYIIGIIFAGLLLLTIALRNLLTIGVYKISIHYFPSYVAVGKINIGDVLQRAEILITVAFLISGFAKISVCLIGAVNGVARLFGFKDYRNLVTPVAILMLNLSFIVYTNVLETLRWAPNIYPYYAFVFQVILPILTYFVYLLRKRAITQLECTNS